MGRPKKILVAPLGWGLGHATRCIPIIQELQRQGVEVLLASDTGALAILRQEFPALPSFELPSYRVRYSGGSMVWGIATQLPKIMWAIWREHKTIRRLTRTYGFDGIISDNRFGCFFSKKRCVFITHQLNIPVPLFGARQIVDWFNHWMINRFDECWVPDRQSLPNLSGRLSHPVPTRLQKKVSYIGALSRMLGCTVEQQRYTVVAVLSGPEPQRSHFEKAILEQSSQVNGCMLVVRGKPDEGSSCLPVVPSNVDIVFSMTSAALNQAILEGGIFIGRSGYSTIMDLARLSKPALLVPTPRQPEQEYLADKLSEENVFFVQRQNDLNLERGIEEARKRTGLQGNFFDSDALSEAVRTFLEHC